SSTTRPLPVDCQQPPERGDEAARDRRNGVSAALVHNRVLRHELRLAGDERHHLYVVVLRVGTRQPAGYLRVPVALLQAQGLDVRRGWLAARGDSPAPTRAPSSRSATRARSAARGRLL